jgi:ferredoxin
VTTHQHRPFRLLHALRRATQVGVVVAAAVTGYRFAHGLSLTSIEKYCPMGGLATSGSLATSQRFSCATGEFNFSLLLALLVLALIARKSFCSWLCPVGTISELIGALVGRVKGQKLRRKSKTHLALLTPPGKADGWLRLLRYPVLLAILYATFTSGELLFRPFCPYYVMFSFHGHDVAMWSYLVLAVFALGIVVIPLVWCRYLCPLGGALWPFARVAPLRIRRHPSACTDCGLCNRACGHSLPVATATDVTSGECTLCLECTQVCPAKGALTVASIGSSRAWPGLVVPLAILVLTLAGLYGGRIYAIPSYSKDYQADPSPTQLKEVRLKVKGVRCVDTAKMAATVFDGMDGIIRYTAYASRNDVVVVYDAALTDVATIVKLIQGPVYLPAAEEFVFHIYDVLEIDGLAVEKQQTKSSH